MFETFFGCPGVRLTIMKYYIIAFGQKAYFLQKSLVTLHVCFLVLQIFIVFFSWKVVVLDLQSVCPKVTKLWILFKRLNANKLVYIFFKKCTNCIPVACFVCFFASGLISIVSIKAKKKLLTFIFFIILENKISVWQYSTLKYILF